MPGQSIDKSTIGCYVSLNNRLLDVMVLSDSDYQISVPVNSKTIEKDRIQVLFKYLAGFDTDEPIGNIQLANLISLGKFEESMKFYKDQSLNKVVKGWINLNNSKSSTQSQGPKALLYYFYGDKTEGQIMIKKEMNSSPVTSYNQVLGQSNEKPTHTKRQSSASANQRNSEANGSGQNVQKGSFVEKDDTKFLITSKISKQLRTDTEISSKVIELNQATNSYMAFDMQKYQNDVNKELENQIGKLHQEYTGHVKQTAGRLLDCEHLNTNSTVLKNDSVNMRLQKSKGLQEISNKNSQFEKKFQQENESKAGIRQQMAELEKLIRQVEKDVAKSNIENDSLKNLIKAEYELRKERGVEELNCVLAVNEDLKNANIVSEEDKRRIKKQKDFIESQVIGFDKTIQESNQRIQDLLGQIQTSKVQNLEQIAKIDTDLKLVLQENKQLKQQNDSFISQSSRLEKDLQALQQQEKYIEQEWNKSVKELEQKIKEKRSETQQVLDNLTRTNLEMSKLKILLQTSQYKVEYEGALKEMYDTHQFETRLRRLQGDIDASQTKSQVLESELKKCNDQWNKSYDDIVQQLKKKIQELHSQQNIESIEKLLVQIKEKDKLLIDLRQGISDLKQEVDAQQNSDQDLQKSKKLADEKLKVFKRILNEKSVLYDEMLSNARQLMNRNDLIIQNEQEIVRIKYEIDISKLEMDQKKELVRELEMKLEQDKAVYKELKLDIKKLEKRQEYLQVVLKQKEDELDQLEEILNDRDNVIADLERQLGELSQIPVKKGDFYRPIKGDLVDELIAKFVNQMKNPVPVKRLGDGYYIFGTKKIFAKIMNSKLVIRVGGGFMVIEEFIAAYGDMELIKVNTMLDRGTLSLDEFKEGAGESAVGTIGQVEASPSKRKRRLSGSPKRDSMSPKI